MSLFLFILTGVLTGVCLRLERLDAEQRDRVRRSNAAAVAYKRSGGAR